MCQPLQAAGITPFNFTGTGPTSHSSLGARLRALAYGIGTTAPALSLANEIDEAIAKGEKAVQKAQQTKSEVLDTLLDEVTRGQQREQELRRATDLIGDLRDGIEAANKRGDELSDKLRETENQLDALTRFEADYLRAAASFLRSEVKRKRSLPANGFDAILNSIAKASLGATVGEDMLEGARQLEELASEIERAVAGFPAL